MTDLTVTNASVARRGRGQSGHCPHELDAIRVAIRNNPDQKKLTVKYPPDWSMQKRKIPLKGYTPDPEAPYGLRFGDDNNSKIKLADWADDDDPEGKGLVPTHNLLKKTTRYVVKAYPNLSDGHRLRTHIITAWTNQLEVTGNLWMDRFDEDGTLEELVKERDDQETNSPSTAAGNGYSEDGLRQVVESAMNELKEEVAAFKEDMRTALDEQGGKIDDLGEQLGEMKETVGEMKETVGKQEEAINGVRTDMDTRFDVMESTLAELKRGNTTRNAGADELKDEEDGDDGEDHSSSGQGSVASSDIIDNNAGGAFDSSEDEEDGTTAFENDAATTNEQPRRGKDGSASSGDGGAPAADATDATDGSGGKKNKESTGTMMAGAAGSAGSLPVPPQQQPMVFSPASRTQQHQSTLSRTQIGPRDTVLSKASVSTSAEKNKCENRQEQQTAVAALGKENETNASDRLLPSAKGKSVSVDSNNNSEPQSVVGGSVPSGRGGLSFGFAEPTTQASTVPHTISTGLKKAVDAVSAISLDDDAAAPAPKPSAPAPERTSKYKKGQTVWYKSDSFAGEAKIVQVHYDDELEPFYTITVNGKEKQTDDKHLSLPSPVFGQQPQQQAVQHQQQPSLGPSGNSSKGSSPTTHMQQQRSNAPAHSSDPNRAFPGSGNGMPRRQMHAPLACSDGNDNGASAHLGPNAFPAGSSTSNSSTTTTNISDQSMDASRLGTNSGLASSGNTMHQPNTNAPPRNANGLSGTGKAAPNMQPQLSNVPACPNGLSAGSQPISAAAKQQQQQQQQPTNASACPGTNGLPPPRTQGSRSSNNTLQQPTTGPNAFHTTAQRSGPNSTNIIQQHTNPAGRSEVMKALPIVQNNSTTTSIMNMQGQQRPTNSSVTLDTRGVPVRGTSSGLNATMNAMAHPDRNSASARPVPNGLHSGSSASNSSTTIINGRRSMDTSFPWGTNSGLASWGTQNPGRNTSNISRLFALAESISKQEQSKAANRPFSQSSVSNNMHQPTVNGLVPPDSNQTSAGDSNNAQASGLNSAGSSKMTKESSNRSRAETPSRSAAAGASALPKQKGFLEPSSFGRTGSRRSLVSSGNDDKDDHSTTGPGASGSSGVGHGHSTSSATGKTQPLRRPNNVCNTGGGSSSFSFGQFGQRVGNDSNSHGGTGLTFAPSNSNRNNKRSIILGLFLLGLSAIIALLFYCPAMSIVCCCLAAIFLVLAIIILRYFFGKGKQP